MSASTALKDRLSVERIAETAVLFRTAWPDFPVRSFLETAQKGLSEMELKARGKHVAQALHEALPPSYEECAEIFCAALGPPLETSEAPGEHFFLYLPWMLYIERYGTEYFEESMRMQYALTQRATAEFSMRPFLERYPVQTLAQLAQWATDPSEHVRRLVSESTRPRLPWAGRLYEFMRDPAPVLALLEPLKDDPNLYVRRSVANNLNDIAKDHPDRVVALMEEWILRATAPRRELIGHALRTLIKDAHPSALALLGYGEARLLACFAQLVEPAVASLGASVELSVEVINEDSAAREVMVDFVVHYVKASGASRPKVFKGKALTLASQGRERVRKKVVLREMTTRQHFNGTHRVEVMINGRKSHLGSFELRGAKAT